MTVDVHRLAANHTHLYPGAKLQPLGVRPITADGTVLIEFADGEVVEGTILDDGYPAILALDAHRTARGSQIQAKRWLIETVGSALRITGHA